MLIAFIASFVIARAVERYRGRRDHLNRAVDGLRADLSALQKATAAYWNSDQSDTSVTQEAEIEFLLGNLSSLMRACSAELWKTQDARGVTLLLELADAATGPQFATPNRKRDAGRVGQVARYCSAVTSQVVSGRRHFFAPKHRLLHGLQRRLGWRDPKKG